MYQAMFIFTVMQWLMIIGLLVFIKEPKADTYRDSGHNDGGDVNPDDIILPPVDGVDYPSQMKRKEAMPEAY